MMIMLGVAIVLGVIWLLLKRHESRMVLIAAGDAWFKDENALNTLKELYR
jgi:hypothetical protein